MGINYFTYDNQELFIIVLGSIMDYKVFIHCYKEEILKNNQTFSKDRQIENGGDRL